jgi:hypothetical protein
MMLLQLCRHFFSHMRPQPALDSPTAAGCENGFLCEQYV